MAYTYRTCIGAPPDMFDKLLYGARAADLPVEQPTRYEFVINLKRPRLLA
jgi:hypothetical protein